MGKRSDRSEFEDDAVMVTGGSGFIGQHLTPKLTEIGKSVVSMYHLRLPVPLANVYPVCSDLSSVDLLAAPLRGVDTVVYLAWEKNFIGSQEDIIFDPNFERVSRNIGQLRNLIEAMERAGTRRIIFMSAIGASRRSKTAFLKEKYLGEFTVLNSNIPEKIIMRTSLVYSPLVGEDFFIQSIMNLMKFPGIYPVPRVQGKLSPILIDDLTRTISDLVLAEMKEPSAILEVSGGEELKIEDIFKLVCEKFAKGSRIQLRGAIGNSLVPIFERRGEYYSPSGPKIKDFMLLSDQRDETTSTDNPVAKILSRQFKGFREVIHSYSEPYMSSNPSTQ